MTLKVAVLQICFLTLDVLFSQLTLAEVYKIPLKRAKGILGKSVIGNGEQVLPYDVGLKGKPGQGYYTEVDIGTPPQKLNILVDTGSSNFAVSAAPKESGYVDSFFNTAESTSFKDLGTEVSVLYTQGNWKGHLATDVLSMPGLPKIQGVRGDLALITSSENFFINGSGWQGIFGLAYKDIARPDSSVTPFFDSLVANAGIPNEFCMLLCGTIDTKNTTDASMGGTLVIGGLDPSLFTGQLYYTSIRQEWYYEVVITDIGVSGKSLAMDCVEYNTDKTIVDSGTTNLRLPERVFNKTIHEIKSRTTLSDREVPDEFWHGEVVMCFNESESPFYGFPTVYIDLAEDKSGNKSYIRLDITAQQYLRAVGEEFDVSPGLDCFKFAIASSVQGTVLGAVIMEGYFVHFDRANKRIGFGNSSCAVRDPAYRALVSGGYNFTHGNTSQCGYIKPPHLTSLQIAAFVIAGITAACLIPLMVLAVHYLVQKYRAARGRQNPHTLIENEHDDDSELVGHVDGENVDNP